MCGPRDDESLAEAIRLIARYAGAHEPHHHIRWHSGDGVRVRQLGRVAADPASPAAL